MVRLSQGTFPRKSPEQHSSPPADFHRFFRGTYAATVRWAVSKGLNRPDAEDVLQDAYACIYQHWTSKYGFRQETDLIRLLRYTVNRKIIDANRRAQTRKRLLSEVTRREEIPYQRDGRKYEELLTQASEILAALPAVSLSVFQRYFVENQTVNDIAESLRLSPDNVRSEISRVRRALREGLASASPAHPTAHPTTRPTARPEEAGR